MPQPITPEAWVSIRRHFRRSFLSNLHVAVATAGSDGRPDVTPIGSLMLNADGTGVFFELFTGSIGRNAAINPQVCVMAVNSGKWFWLGSLLRGVFTTPPMVKLYGTLGVRRPATPQELARFRKRTSFIKYTPGGKRLWGNLHFVREIHFHDYEPAKVGAMTSTSRF